MNQFVIEVDLGPNDDMYAIRKHKFLAALTKSLDHMQSPTPSEGVVTDPVIKSFVIKTFTTINVIV